MASDQHMKTGFRSVDPEEILERVARLPISTWSYRADPKSQHIGPMAQDVYAAFGVGEDERHITTIDGVGISLAAIKGLYQQNQELKKENDAIKAELAEMRVMMQQLLVKEK